ncbi:solute carrier family 43 member 3-like isoform X2 [Mizuhopecten yessoensis]|uniref:solute carrier family 43 member 3-like isoform X2 n=1 Tax=Mizuhopecten yessoensis TaxID=6573 RepID=UPI000B458B9D|nr:solute carrier family 43 member 3-like isoform X2 [Mizuhopecten yessoensis]
MKYDGWRKYLVAGWAILETFLFAGLIYGWAPLVWIFKQEGVYANLCSGSTNVTLFYSNLSIDGQSSYNVMTMRSSSAPTTDGDLEHDLTCQPQDDKFALAFTIGSAIFCASSAAYGFIIYKTGTRFARTISMTIFVGGTTMLAFVDKEKPWLVFPGLAIMGVGGLPVLITNAQLAYEEGMQSQYSFGILAGLQVIVAVSTFVFLPKDRIHKLETSNQAGGEETVESFITEKTDIQDPDSPVYLKTTEPLKENSETSRRRHPSLKNCIISDTYILHVLWVCILQLRFYYFLGSMNSYLHRITDNNKLLVSQFTNTMMYTMVCGAISSSFAGVVYDWQRKIFRERHSHLQRQILPSILPISVGSGLGMLLSVMVLVPSLDILYGDFIVMTLLRSFLYSSATTFLATVFPSEYFEVLYGIMIITAGVFGCLQFALFTWSQSYQAAPVHSDVFCICLTAVSFIHPIYHWFKCRRDTDYNLDKN